MKVKAKGKKTTSNVAYFALFAVTVSLVIGFVLLNATGGAGAPAGTSSEVALSQTRAVGGTQTSGGNPSGVKTYLTLTITVAVIAGL